jgi:hypothetical protein
VKGALSALRYFPCCFTLERANLKLKLSDV